MVRDQPPTALVATLVASAASPVLDARTIESARNALPSSSIPVWLAPGVAADIPFTAQHGDLRALSKRVRAALGGAPIDVVVQPAAGRRKKLLLSDMDSTMVGQECIDELAEHAGVK